jgi:hypothetical protein
LIRPWLAGFEVTGDINGYKLALFGMQPYANTLVIRPMLRPRHYAMDIHRQIEQRRAKQAAEEEKSKAEALLRQVAQVKMAAGVMPKDITPPAAQLPPPAPDNIAPETFEPPPPESAG